MPSTKHTPIAFTAAESAHIDECYAFIVPLVRECGAIVRRGFAECSSQVVSTKAGTWDLVTLYDRQIEERLIGAIRERWPHHQFVAEETAAENALSAAPTWIIDPIDGTNNFVHGIAVVGISVALVVRGEIAVGVVYNPVMEEMYKARVGAGAFCNDVPMRSSAVKTVSSGGFGEGDD